MRIGLDVAQHRLTWSDLLDRVRFAERAGFDGVWLFDHFKPLYGEGPGPCLEAWSVLAGLGAATERVRLGALVTGITYRHPSVLATQAVAVDHISAGRLELGLGAAWFEEEHRELGIDFPPAGERVARLGEALQVIRSLLTTDGISFSGRHYRLDGATYLPRPVQQPHPPIWIGAGGDRMLTLAGRHADVWHSFGPVEVLSRRSAAVDRAAERAGRDPAAISRSTSISLSQPWRDLRAEADRLRAAGFTYLVAGWPSEGHGRVEEFVDRVLPELAAA